MNRQQNIVVKSLTMILCGLLAFINLSEWYFVKIQGRSAEYPFGGEGPTPYYYKTAELYSVVNLIWGIVFLSILIFTIWAIVTRRKKWTTLAFGLTIILLFGLLVHGQIGTN